MTEICYVKFVMRSIKNIADRKENAGYQHFLLFPQVSFNTKLCGKELP